MVRLIKAELQNFRGVEKGEVKFPSPISVKIYIEDVENADDKTVIILTPDGYRDVIKKVKNKPKSIYIYANNSTIKERLINRGDNPKEAQRRLEHDNIDFKGVETEVDKIVYNNKGSNINDVVNKILKYLEES